MKKSLRKIVAKILWSQVGRLQKKHKFKTIAVAGSVGKTSTKLAAATLLGQKYKIKFQSGNYNDLVSVPLIFFGRELPSLFNPLAWTLIFLQNEAAIARSYPFEIVIIELGTDAPGQLAEFKPYLKAELGILTGIAPEHMEFFEDLDAVAKEELTIAELSKKLIVNKDLCPPKYLRQITKPTATYSVSQSADVQLDDIKFEDFSADFKIKHRGKEFLTANHELVTEPQLHAIAAAVSAAIELELSAEQIEKGLSGIKPVSGRMNRLNGANGSTVIDDTYNASPEATAAALHALYRLNAPYKIAVLGNMNELGGYSPAAHKQIGQLCDPEKVDLVVTIGPDAGKHLAPAAKAQGCNVEVFQDPYAAGGFVRGQLKPQSLVLVKGSQNGVFAEEAVKILLANPEDATLLIRQSESWLSKKQKNFKNRQA